jgi:hypothetical protein
MSFRRGFCCNVFTRLKKGFPRALLLCKGRKLLECRDICLTKLVFGDHTRSFNPSQCTGGRMEHLEVKHRSFDPLVEAVVLLNDVVEKFGLYDCDNLTSSRKF